ncbi:MAG TPA: bifunctional lysylphosphatidylglycerol flippase/synthetase MprF [Nitrospirota bacterium]|nr:bifunctional lysylphosphatidylglycerol flippase/synthetase MprF [Nitrospirota bacterium]
MNRQLIKMAGPVLGLALFLTALWVLHHTLSGYHYRDLAAGARTVPAARLLSALLLTVLNYLVLTGYDALAFRYIRHTLEYGRIAFASFIGYAFSNNIGLSMLAGISVRYRLYTSWGLSILEVTKMVAFYTLTLWLGLLFVGGLALIAQPAASPAQMNLPFISARSLGVAFLAVVCGYVGWSAFRRKPVAILHREIELPSASLSAQQIALSSLDWLLAGSVLYVLLPEFPGLSFPAFIGIYILAQVAGLVSQVPGGLGVFETVVILLLPPGSAAPQIFGALLLYRGIYYLLPLIVAAVMMGAYELVVAKAQVKGFVKFMGQGVSAIAPWVLSLIIFAAGALLLFSGATPGLPGRLEWITDILPLPFLEISHFLGSIVGVALLLLARGIQRRLDAAFHLTLVLLGAGILFSLLKGFDYEEAMILAIMLGALLPSRRFFYRRTSLLEQRFSAGWIAAIAAVLLGSIWLGLFSYRHLSYSQELWWRFAVKGDAPRFLRATVGVIALAVIVGAVRLLRPTPPEPPETGGEDKEKVRSVVLASTDTTANLALLGDKRFLFSENGKSFIMYGIAGRSWVVMGDPVGPESERKDLVWRFRELCDRHGGIPVFYEVGKENLYLYLDMGLTPLKIGEEACVPLPEFSLEGGRRKSLRSVHARVLREGAAFSVVPATEVPPLLPQLRTISDAWLLSKNTREKRFSLGYFDEAYLAEFPCALVKKAGEIVAFANIWTGAGKQEVSIDLMRQVPDSARGTMEFLFVELMLWGKERGYRWFNLGMAPLSGLEDRALAPLWSRLGAQIFRHGEHFYNFKGLRQFKEHFDPQWEPRYIVCPRGFLLPRILANLSSLISGGLMGAIGK